MALVKKLPLAALCVCGATLLAPSAMAQLSRDGGAIEIVADRGELDDVKRQAVYIGNVDVVQGDARLRAKEVVINYNARQGTSGAGGGIGSSVGDIQNIQATGDVYYITAREKVKADRGVYNAKDETINLTGNVRVTNADGPGLYSIQQHAVHKCAKQAQLRFHLNCPRAPNIRQRST